MTDEAVELNIEELQGRLVGAYGLLLSMGIAMSSAGEDEADVRAVEAIAGIVMNAADDLTPVVNATGGLLRY